jgi:hypothetical protein
MEPGGSLPSLQVEVNLRPAVRWPVCLGVEVPSGAHDHISVFCLKVCEFLEEPSLTRGLVCNLLVQLLLGLARVFTLGSKSHRTQRSYFSVSNKTPPTCRVRFPYLYPPGTGWPSYIPGLWVLFTSSLSTRRDYGGGILTRPHTGL